MSILLKNCRILQGDSIVTANIMISGGKIEKIMNDEYTADTVVDVKQHLVLPGLIDPHVHFREPGGSHKEDWLTGSMSAVAGGVTTVLDMPNTSPPVIDFASLEQKRQLAKKSLVNYGFHFGATPFNIGEIQNLDQFNVAGLKVFMGSSTGNLLVDKEEDLKNIFKACKKVILVHAEDEEIIRQNAEKHTENHVRSHSKIRSNEAAARAMERAINLSKKFNRKLYICHMSTKEEVALAKQYKNKNLFCEVTPHHLFLNTDDYDKLGNFGRMNPPLRSKEDQVALWNGIKRGFIHTIATDHAPHLKSEKEKPYKEAPSGVPGVETMLPLLLDAMQKNMISLAQLQKLTSYNPARIFGMHKFKGQIKEGFDADLVVVDQTKEWTIRGERLFTKCKWTPFEGRKVKGEPVLTIVNGNIVYREGHVYDKAKGNEIKFS